ncbi:MAG: divalent metal cation transporter [Terriglobales bacterium]
MVAVYSSSSRIGYETHKGLVDLLRQNYGQLWAIVCAGLVIAINMAMIIADLMAVSDAFSIILGQRRAFFVGAVAFSVWYILIFRDYRKITQALLWLSLPLFVYVPSAMIVTPSAGTLLHRIFVPHIVRSGNYVAAVVAIFGSLLTPYILVWQTSSRREHAVIGEETPHMAQSQAGTSVTTLLSFSIIIAAGSVLHLPDGPDDHPASRRGLASCRRRLRTNHLCPRRYWSRHGGIAGFSGLALLQHR